MPALDNGRSIIYHGENDTEIVIPSRRRLGWLFLSLFLTTLLFLSLGIIFILYVPTMIPFLPIILIIFGIPGFGLLYLLLRFITWEAIGKENFKIAGDEVLFGKRVTGIKPLEILEAKHISNLRLNDKPNFWQFMGWGKGTLKFDYGMKTYSLGYYLDEAEAMYLKTFIEKHLSIS